MDRTKANFTAIREFIGLSKSELGEAVGVSSQAIKRWQRLDWPDPPEDVWEYLESMVEIFVSMKNQIVLSCQDKRCVRLLYFRTVDEFEHLAVSRYPVGFVNAVARDAWRALAGFGVSVEFDYPEEGRTIELNGPSDMIVSSDEPKNERFVFERF